jgi:hypothetical protein
MNKDVCLRYAVLTVKMYLQEANLSQKHPGAGCAQKGDMATKFFIISA